MQVTVLKKKPKLNKAGHVMKYCQNNAINLTRHSQTVSTKNVQKLFSSFKGIKTPSQITISHLRKEKVPADFS